MMDSRKIMVVEDSPTQSLRLQASLEAEGFDAACVGSAEEALETLNDVRPDIIVVDYHLPGIQGDDLCRRIRMNINTQSIPIVMLTIDQNIAAELHSLESGADDYVAKTDDLDILMLRIHNLLRKSGWKSSIINPEESFFRKARVLAIDDSPTYLEFLDRELENEGYDVTTTTTGKDGIRLALEGEFDCILVDLILPDVDGIEACRKISQELGKRSLSIVILMVSSQETKGNVMNALESGANDFVGKSSAVSILKGRIRALLRQKFLREQSQKILDKLKEREGYLERLVAERTKELKNSENEAQEARKQAEAANHAKTHFLANMSHELRTPLNAIIGFSDMMLNEVNGHISNIKYREYIKNIYDSGHHLNSIIHDILDISSIEVGKINMNEEELRIEEIVNAAWRLVKHPAERGRIKLLTELDDNLPLLFADERLMKQIFLNVLSNAVKFTENRGLITVTASADKKDGMTISIRDTGIGIAADEIAEVLKPFSRIDSTIARKYAGTGLGLPLSKSFVELHGGTFELQSTVGKGTTVIMKFPNDRVIFSPRNERGKQI